MLANKRALYDFYFSHRIETKREEKLVQLGNAKKRCKKTGFNEEEKAIQIDFNKREARISCFRCTDPVQSVLLKEFYGFHI